MHIYYVFILSSLLCIYMSLINIIKNNGPNTIMRNLPKRTFLTDDTVLLFEF